MSHQEIVVVLKLSRTCLRESQQNDLRKNINLLLAEKKQIAGKFVQCEPLCVKEI